MRVLIFVLILFSFSPALASFPDSTGWKGIQLIKHFEGYMPCKYLDAAGHPTIGYGHLIIGTMPECISPEKAHMLLEADLRRTERDVRSLATSLPEQHRFDALVSLIYNVGINRFKRSKAHYYLVNNQIEKFKHEAFDSEAGFVKAGGRILRGLVLRRWAEQTLFDN